MSAAEVAEVSGIDGEFTGERSAEGFVGGDENFEALIDLAIRAFAALLDGEHDEQSDADTDDRDQREREERGEQVLPRAEIDVSHDR